MMLSRPLTLNDSDDRGRGMHVTPSPAHPSPAVGGNEEETQRGVFCPPAPPWSSSSSSPSSPPLPPPLCASSFPPPLRSSAPPSIDPPLPPSVCFTPSTSSVFSPLVPWPPPPCSSSFFFHPPSLHYSPPLFSSSPSVPASVHPPTPSMLTPPPASFTSSPPPLHVPPLFSSDSAPPPPASCSPPSVLSTSHISTVSSSLSSSSSSSPLAPSSVLSPPPPPSLPCCPCSSLLPRLLSAHRLEVRRLLRGALASLGRRLDSLERRSRRKKKKSRRQKGEEGGAAGSPASSSSCSPALLPTVTSSSSSSSSLDGEESHAPLPSSSFRQPKWMRRRRGGEEEVEEEEVSRRRTNHRAAEFRILPEHREEEEDEGEEEDGRFVGRMVVTFTGGQGAEEEAPLTLHSFSQRTRKRRAEGDTSQSEKAISTIVRKNGYRVPPPLPPPHSSSSQQALHLLQSAHSSQTCSQSEAFTVSSGQWCFSDVTPAFSFSSNHSAFRLCLWSSSSSFSPAPMLRLSAVAVKTLSESVRSGACWRPLRPLRDWTAPPSLSSDHCYVRSSTPSSAVFVRRQQRQRTNHSARSLHLPRRRLPPLPACSANGLSSPVPADQSEARTEFLSTNAERGKRVSQIRIRRASPRETPLTPMGLPKVKRLRKKEFSLEEIYTNKNYKSPTTNRSLETIFEEPREKDGALLLIGHQRRRRLLLFHDFTQPRKRKRPPGVGLPVATVPRKRAAARRHCHGSGDDDADLDVMLVERLSALEDFLTRQGLDL